MFALKIFCFGVLHNFLKFIHVLNHPVSKVSMLEKCSQYFISVVSFLQFSLQKGTILIMLAICMEENGHGGEQMKQ